jgi:hypothetical protein
MTFLDKLKDHVGGLIRIKTQIYWYEKRKWDGIHERVCLLLDTLNASRAARARLDGRLARLVDTVDRSRWLEQRASLAHGAAVLLFIDGIPKLIWAYESAVELVE